jgi:hypothetical protein
MIPFIAALTLLAVQPAGTSTAVVFVCEHGAAKSVIATAYFNKLAAERGLPHRATFRGTTPQDDLSVRAVAGLKEDGIVGDWSDVPDDKGYGPMRDAIVRHVKELLDRLQAGQPNPRK